MRKRTVLFALSAILAFTLPAPAWSSETEETKSAAAKCEETESFAAAEDARKDNLVTTKHTAVIQGKELSYTAQAGTMVLETGGSFCEIFFTAYTLDGVEDPADRPVTFAFNGGPGTCRKDAKAWFGSGSSMGTDQDNREK